MTERQVSREARVHGLAGEARRAADVAAYRDAVTSLLIELAGPSRYLTVETAERLLARRLRDPVFTAVLSAVPRGPEAALRRVLGEGALNPAFVEKFTTYMNEVPIHSPAIVAEAALHRS